VLGKRLSCAKTVGRILTVYTPYKEFVRKEVLFGDRNTAAPHLLGIIPMTSIFVVEGAIFVGKNMPVRARRHSTVSCAKMSKPIEMPFGL